MLDCERWLVVRDGWGGRRWGGDFPVQSVLKYPFPKGDWVVRFGEPVE